MKLLWAGPQRREMWKNKPLVTAARIFKELTPAQLIASLFDDDSRSSGGGSEDQKLSSLHECNHRLAKQGKQPTRPWWLWPDVPNKGDRHRVHAKPARRSGQSAQQGNGRCG